MASSGTLKKSSNSTPVPIAKVIMNFWSGVTMRLVKTHRLEPETAKRAVRVYRKRVGNVAMNGGPLETSRDIASAVKSGGFIQSRRLPGGRVVQKKMSV